MNNTLDFNGNNITPIEKRFAKAIDYLQILYLNDSVRVSKLERGMLYGVPVNGSVLWYRLHFSRCEIN